MPIFRLILAAIAAAPCLGAANAHRDRWLSVADTIAATPAASPQDLAAGLLATQDRDGVWHTVLNDPASYPECSATTMSVYGFLKLARLGLLPERYREAALKAWHTVNERWVNNGVVTGVSRGTSPTGKDTYLKLEMGTYAWGTGAYLMAGSEVDRLP